MVNIVYATHMVSVIEYQRWRTVSHTMHFVRPPAWAPVVRTEGPRVFPMGLYIPSSLPLTQCSQPYRPLRPYEHHTLAMVLLVSSDNEQFHVDRDVVERFALIKNMLDGQSDTSFHLVN